jgi:phospholipid transport system substrate-binding protein
MFGIGPHLLKGVVSASAIVIVIPSAHAGAPTEELRGRVDQVIRTLQRSDRQGESNTTDRRMAVHKAADEIFAFEEAATRSLGRHWQERTPSERAEFTRIYTELLEHAYISKIDRYGGENVNYVGESVDADEATVRTKILTKQGSEVPVDYRMLRQAAGWRVYDVIIEGVSLTANYRTQFNKIIQTSSFEDLMAKLRTKASSTSEDAKGKHG